MKFLMLRLKKISNLFIGFFKSFVKVLTSTTYNSRYNYILHTRYCDVNILFSFYKLQSISK